MVKQRSSGVAPQECQLSLEDHTAACETKARKVDDMCRSFGEAACAVSIPALRQPSRA